MFSSQLCWRRTRFNGMMLLSCSSERRGCKLQIAGGGCVFPSQVHALQEDYKSAIDVYTEAPPNHSETQRPTWSPVSLVISFRPRRWSFHQNMQSCWQLWASCICGILALNDSASLQRWHDIHAAPRQGPPAPRSQGVINASGFVWSVMCLCLQSLCKMFHVGGQVAPQRFCPKNMGCQTSKNRVFSAIFVPLEEKMLVFTMFLQHQGQN